MLNRWLRYGMIAVAACLSAPSGAMAATDARALDSRSLSAAARGGEWPTALEPCPNPTRVEATPATVKEVVEAAGSGCVELVLAPGHYPRVSARRMEGLTVRCAEDMACSVDIILLHRLRYGDVEGIVFPGAAKREGGRTDYGIQIHHVHTVRIVGNLFKGRYNHDISTKQHVGYAEITNNEFIECARHCIEIGQNANVKSSTSRSGIAYVADNIFRGAKMNGITQRNNQLLVIYRNTFEGSGAYSIRTWPYWRPFDYGQSGGPEINMLMPGPLRTEIVDNRFVGHNEILLEGRGRAEDSVLLKGNTGSFACNRIAMTHRAAKAHLDVEATTPPRLDTASDNPC